MITIDWKERLTKDTQDYMENKLPKQDYNFEIIFNWYPERINGKIPAEVIVLVTKFMTLKISRQHELYIPFYQHLWDNKGENGKIAFVQFMSRFLPKKPAVYQPIIEKILLKAEAHDIAAIFEKIYLPLLKKETEPYMPLFYKWIESAYEPLNKQAMGFLARLLKKMPELVTPVLKHLQNRWNYPLGEAVHTHIVILKAIWKIEPDAVMHVFREYSSTRDPQTVEILCGAVMDYYQELEPIVENWTRSGNARLKKAATTAHKTLLKKKG
jgi:hypothetical protein